MHFQQPNKKPSSSAERPKSNLGAAERDDSFFEPGKTGIAPGYGTGSCQRMHAANNATAK
jgi:hypothetical protein